MPLALAAFALAAAAAGANALPALGALPASCSSDITSLLQVEASEGTWKKQPEPPPRAPFLMQKSEEEEAPLRHEKIDKEVSKVMAKAQAYVSLKAKENTAAQEKMKVVRAASAGEEESFFEPGHEVDPWDDLRAEELAVISAREQKEKKERKAREKQKQAELIATRNAERLERKQKKLEAQRKAEEEEQRQLEEAARQRAAEEAAAQEAAEEEAARRAAEEEARKAVVKKAAAKKARKALADKATVDDSMDIYGKSDANAPVIPSVFNEEVEERGRQEALQKAAKVALASAKRSKKQRRRGLPAAKRTTRRSTKLKQAPAPAPAEALPLP